MVVPISSFGFKESIAIFFKCSGGILRLQMHYNYKLAGHYNYPLFFIFKGTEISYPY